MNRIHNLAEHNMSACSIKAGVPIDDRLVVVQANIGGFVKTVGARYVNDRWIGEEQKLDVTEELNSCEYAIWFESMLFLPTSAATLVPLSG